MVTHTRGHRQRRHQHQHRQLYWAVGREQPRPMEPPQNRGTQDYQPLGWHHKLKNQVKHPLLNIYNLIKLNPSQESATEIRLIQYATGRKNPEKEKVLCTDRQQTSYTERTPDQWSFYTRRVFRFRFHLLHLGYRNQWLYFWTVIWTWWALHDVLFMNFSSMLLLLLFHVYLCIKIWKRYIFFIFIHAMWKKHLKKNHQMLRK